MSITECHIGEVAGARQTLLRSGQRYRQLEKLAVAVSGGGKGVKLRGGKGAEEAGFDDNRTPSKGAFPLAHGAAIDHDHRIEHTVFSWVIGLGMKGIDRGTAVPVPDDHLIVIWEQMSDAGGRRCIRRARRAPELLPVNLLGDEP